MDKDVTTNQKDPLGGDAHKAAVLRVNAKSMALWQAIGQKINKSSDPVSYLQDALGWVRQFQPRMPDVPYLTDWERLLQEAVVSPEAACNMLNWITTCEDDYAITMRSCSPFPGVLTQKERTEILAQFSLNYGRNKALQAATGIENGR